MGKEWPKPEIQEEEVGLEVISCQSAEIDETA